MRSNLVHGSMPFPTFQDINRELRLEVFVPDLFRNGPLSGWISLSHSSGWEVTDVPLVLASNY